jgi:hypothetical protein
MDSIGYAKPRIYVQNLSKYADGRTPMEIITGDTPDISEYLDFDFYDWVVFRSKAGLGEAKLGRWLYIALDS